MLVSVRWLHSHGAQGCAPACPAAPAPPSPGAPVLEKAISIVPGLSTALTLQIKPQGNVIGPVPFPVLLKSCWVITSLSSCAASLFVSLHSIPAKASCSTA